MSTIMSESESQPTPTPETGTVGTVGTEANTLPDWMQDLPEDLRGNATITTIPNKETLVRNYIASQSQIGKLSDQGRLVSPPSKHSTDDEFRNFLIAGGLPKALEEYEVQSPEGYMDENTLNEWKETFFKLGVYPKAAQGIMEKAHEIAQKMQQSETTQAEARREETQKNLEQKYGLAWKDKVSQARRALEEFGSEKLIEKLDQSGLGDDVDFIETFIKIGNSYEEEKLGKQPASNAQVPANAKEEVRKLMLDPAYFDAKHPNHNQVVNEVFKLNQIAHPEPLT